VSAGEGLLLSNRGPQRRGSLLPPGDDGDPAMSMRQVHRVPVAGRRRVLRAARGLHRQSGRPLHLQAQRQQALRLRSWDRVSRRGYMRVRLLPDQRRQRELRLLGAVHQHQSVRIGRRDVHDAHGRYLQHGPGRVPAARRDVATATRPWQGDWAVQVRRGVEAERERGYDLETDALRAFRCAVGALDVEAGGEVVLVGPDGHGLLRIEQRPRRHWVLEENRP